MTASCPVCAALFPGAAIDLAAEDGEFACSITTASGAAIKAVRPTATEAARVAVLYAHQLEG